MKQIDTCKVSASAPCWWKLKGSEEGDIVSRLYWHIENSMANPVWKGLLTDSIAEIENLRGFKEGFIAGRSTKQEEHIMELEYRSETGDGGAVYMLDMKDEELRSMVELGVQFAIVCGAAGVKPMDIMSDMLKEVQDRNAETDRLAEENSASAEDQK
jgi:hypothetical protein